MSSSNPDVNNIFNSFFNNTRIPPATNQNRPAHNPFENLFPQMPTFPNAANQNPLFGRGLNRPSPASSSTRAPTMPAMGDDDMTSFRIQSQALIAGFLNLGESDGWVQGGNPGVAERFIRYSAIKFDRENPEQSSISSFFQSIFSGEDPNNKSRTTIRNVIHGLPINDVMFLFGGNFGSIRSCSPTQTRVVQDVAVQGWENHKVGRIVGNLGSTYSPSKPFFEVIINSHTKHPFFISIHPNEEKLNERRATLRSMTEAPRDIALSIYFASSLVKPKEFLELHADKLGTNSKRMIEGLRFLQEVEMETQHVGNCWMKQPLRTMLAALYLETLSGREELSPNEAWAEAMRLYKAIQLQSLSIIETLLNEIDVDPRKMNIARAEIVRRRGLLTSN